MKKILLSLGTLAAVVAPIATMVSCGSTEKTSKAKPSTPETNKDIETNKDTTSNASGTASEETKSLAIVDNKEIHVLDPSKGMDVLATGKRTHDLGCWHLELDQAHLDNAAKIREYMNKTQDIQWHTYGDPILDGINAVRLAINESANGDQTLKHMIRDFADNGGAISNPGNGWQTDNRKADPKDNAFKAMAKKQVNDWFDNDKELLVVRDIPGWANIEGVDAAKKKADSTYDKFNDKDRHVLFDPATAKSDTLSHITKTYGALTLGTPELLTSEHRAQEDDWLGHFDGHDHGGTMKLIKDGAKTSGDQPTGVLAKPPRSDEGFKGEDYMFPFTYNDHKFEEGADFVSGLLTAINVLYDTDDGSATTGHRTNFYAQDLTTFGWSRHAANDSNFQYLFTEAGKEALPGRVATAAEIKVHSGIQLMYDGPVSSEDLDKITKANPFFNEFTKEALKYLSPMNFLNKINVNKEFLDNGYQNFVADQHGSELVAELYKPHATLKELETALEKPFTSAGFADWIDLKQLTTYQEFGRFAHAQKVGKPDTLVKTYDYNGGSTITGEQYGVSPIDKTLFE